MEDHIHPHVQNRTLSILSRADVSWCQTGVFKFLTGGCERNSLLTSKLRSPPTYVLPSALAVIGLRLNHKRSQSANQIPEMAKFRFLN